MAQKRKVAKKKTKRMSARERKALEVYMPPGDRTMFYLSYSQGRGGKYKIALEAKTFKKAEAEAKKKWRELIEGRDPDDVLANDHRHPHLRSETHYASAKIDFER